MHRSASFGRFVNLEMPLTCASHENFPHFGGKCAALSLATGGALRSPAALMTASNDGAILVAGAGVEEGGASTGDAGGGGARRPREKPGSSRAAPEKAAEIQPYKKRSKQSQ
jgi:hypothetical protein